MTKRFTIKELEDVVKPYDLIDVLDSLMENQYIDSYYYDFENGQIEMDIPKGTEVMEILKGFEDLRDPESKKRKMH